MSRVELNENEKGLPYVKYYYQDLAPISEEKLAIARGKMANPKDALNIKDKNLYLKGEDNGIQQGFTIMEDGTGYVANSTFMKDVTVEMMQW